MISSDNMDRKTGDIFIAFSINKQQQKKTKEIDLRKSLAQQF
jgi:hypothetical protein